ncbi:MAG: 2OG-Fe(II) oxygenase [Alphaproteobacteria bacterium]|nr:2OG-Fe(II) oxygenase [Alphaproteobacteria bacterium]
MSQQMSQELLESYPTCVAVEDVFTPEELDRIIAHGDGLEAEKAILHSDGFSQAEADKIRITRNAWMANTPDSKWIYDRVFQVMGVVNKQAYQFDLKGFAEDFQYTIYHGEEGGHYDWHMDLGPRPMPRKLSMSLQLSDPADYDGCDLQFYASRQLEVAPRIRGAAIVFPSYILHRVTPITRGTRKSLVVWANGPRFR